MSNERDYRRFFTEPMRGVKLRWRMRFSNLSKWANIRPKPFVQSPHCPPGIAMMRPPNAHPLGIGHRCPQILIKVRKHPTASKSRNICMEYRLNYSSRHLFLRYQQYQRPCVWHDMTGMLFFKIALPTLVQFLAFNNLRTCCLTSEKLFNSLAKAARTLETAEHVFFPRWLTQLTKLSLRWLEPSIISMKWLQKNNIQNFKFKSFVAYQKRHYVDT